MSAFREVVVSALAPSVLYQMDKRIEIQSTIRDASGIVRHNLRLTDLSDQTSVFRINGLSGPIVSPVKHRAMSVRSGSKTIMLVKEGMGNNTYKALMPVIINGLYPDATVQLDIFIGGVTFENGALTKTLSLTDFDYTGNIDLYFIKAGDTGSNCHRTSVWQSGKRIAYFQ